MIKLMLILMLTFRNGANGSQFYSSLGKLKNEILKSFVDRNAKCSVLFVDGPLEPFDYSLLPTQVL